MMRRTLTTAGLPTQLPTQLATLLIAILIAAPALALDDGGGRSVFARGAGERALALGGAYAAVTDGPDAMIWNPAGLAQLERKNLYASHSNLIGLGFSEQLGLLALPNWKLGTIGLGIRRFGVDGIEGRNDRGAIVDENLKDSETEVLLGFSRTVGGVWNLGAVAKYQQHSLAGYSDGAPGLDLGVMVKPIQAAGGQSRLAEALTVGIAVRNLIEPNLRLDEEGVKDPTGMRLGLAYADNVSPNLRLLLTSDVEKTRDMDTRVHAGAELRLMDLLDLRVGSNAGLMSAGAGIRYRNLEIDYAFEDNPLEPVHRFGVGIAFGPTSAESRQASLNAQEAELRRQLAAAFLRENENRLQTTIAQARRALDDNNFDEALSRVETARVLEPGYSGLGQLNAEIFYRQALALEEEDDLSGAAISLQRCLANDADHVQATARLASVSARSNLLAARSEVIRDRFDAALEAYAGGDLVQAKKGFAQVLELEPNDKEAAALLRSTQQALTMRAGSLIEQAQAQAEAHNLVAATANLAKARTLAPDHRSLASVAAIIATEEERAAAAVKATRAAQATAIAQPVAPAKPSYKSLSVKDQEEVDDLYRNGLRAVENRRHEDAIRYWELVWSRAPDYQQVAENLKREYLAQGMEAFADGRLDTSIEIWEKAQVVVPDDPKTSGYLARAYEHKARIREIQGDRR